MFFEYPYLLWLELILIPLIALYIWREYRGSSPSMIVSNSTPWKAKGGHLKSAASHTFRLRMIAIAAIIVAIARPRTSETFETVDTEGVDIVLTMDISTSMLA